MMATAQRVPPLARIPPPARVEGTLAFPKTRDSLL